MDRHQDAEARRQLERAVELDPNLANAEANLSLLCAKTRDYAGAIRHGKRALALDPKQIDCYHYIAVALRGEGRFDEAVHELERLLEIDPALRGRSQRDRHHPADAGAVKGGNANRLPSRRSRPDALAAFAHFSLSFRPNSPSHRPNSHEGHRLSATGLTRSDEPLIAVFIDFENLAIGVRGMKTGDFQIQLVLKRLLEKGRIVFKRAYCDWSHYRDAIREFHSQGIELIDIPQSKMSGKNSADIRMVVDAMDLCYSKHHIDVFALVSGDSDFSPLVSKLKENNNRVIGCGVKSSTSDLLIANCDEFIYYDDLVRTAQKGTAAAAPKKGVKRREDKKQEALDRLLEVVHSLEQDYDPIWGSMLKQVIRRVYPGFNEGYYGYNSFSELLEDAAESKMIELEFDQSRRNYQIRPKKESPMPVDHPLARGHPRSIAGTGRTCDNRVVPPFPFTAELVVERYLSGVRIDSFLARHFRNYTPWKLQRIVAAGQVKLDGNTVEIAERVYQGDTVSIRLIEPPDKVHRPQPLAVDIVYEDAWLIVVDKPPGQIVHPAGDLQTGTLCNALQHHFDQQTAWPGLLRPGIVHRLDRMTSGLIVVAKEHLAHRQLSIQFQQERISKSYLALVEGVLADERGTIDVPIGTSPEAGSVLMSCSPEAGDRRPSRTDYEVLARGPEHTLVRARPRTGRNHQIRLHMAEIGHPVVGDEFYGPYGAIKLSKAEYKALCRPPAADLPTEPAQTPATPDERQSATTSKPTNRGPIDAARAPPRVRPPDPGRPRHAVAVARGSCVTTAGAAASDATSS